jgi:anti-sigma regulatory factor (Ser/Thr protein kinase)
MHIEFVNRLDELANVMATIERFSVREGLAKCDRQALELSLDELLTNTISYGYPESEQHKIQVDINIRDNNLETVVQDDGVAFNPFEHEAPDLELSIDERNLGGIGIHLIKKFMDEFSYQRIAGRNVVTLLKALDQG